MQSPWLPILSKYEIYIRLSEAAKTLDRSCTETERVHELTKVRNEFVHPKMQSISATVGAFEQQGENVALPLTLDGEHWNAVGIPKRPLFWSADNAKSAFTAVVTFLRMVICDYVHMSPEDARYHLHSRVEIGTAATIATFDEFVSELTAEDLGVDVAFLGISPHP